MMLAVMAAVFAYVRLVVAPVAREDALLAEARAASDPFDRDTALRAAAEANPLAWEPALARGRMWQAQAMREQGPGRTVTLERAMEAYRGAVARQPRLRHALLGLASCRLAIPSAIAVDRAALQDALRYTEAARRLYPTDIPTQAQAAALVDALEDRPARALAEFRRLLDLDRLMPEEDRRLPADLRREFQDRARELEESLARPAPAR